MSDRRWIIAPCLLATLAVLSALAPGVLSPTAAAPNSPAALPSGFGAMTPMGTSTPSLAGLQVQGPMPANELLSGGLSFAAPDTAAQQALIQSIYTPGSPQYHHFLANGQFESRFAPNPALQDALLAYLTSHGIQVTQTSVYLWNLVGTPSQMGSAFGTTFVDGSLNGHAGFAPSGTLSLPSRFAGFATVSGGFQSVAPLQPTDLVRAPSYIVGAHGSPAAYRPGIGAAALTINITSPYIIQYQNHNTAIAFPPTNVNSTWTLTLAGGTAPYSVSWHWNDGTIQNFVTSAASLPNFHSYYQPGQSDYCDVVVCGNVTVFVNDSASGSATYDVGLVPGVSPTTAQLYYDTSTLARKGLSGQGTKIGLDEMCDPGYTSYLSDLTTYSTDMGLPAPSLSLIGTGASSCTLGSSGWSGETLLDMESAHALAPNATLVVDLADSTIDEGDCTWNTLSNGVYLASNSWGTTISASCWNTAASQGESYQTASGDCGAFTSGTRDEPADFATDVGVGGTDVYPQPSGIFLREFAWNGTFQSSCSNNEGSTGGYSSLAAPYYQIGMTGFTGTKRGVPDVAAIGGTWFWMIYTGGVTLSAGTSLACPSYTAMIDLMWQYNSSTPKPQGMANYNLYTIAKSSNYDTAMHDIVVGNNIHGTSPPGSGYTTTVGWDPVTGLGSPDTGKLAMFLASQNGNTGAFGALTAVLAANVTFGPTSLAVDFGADVTGGSSSLTGYSYAWTFGDGATATTALAWTTHTYTTPGIYWATVTATLGANSGTSNGVMVHVTGTGGGGGGGNPSVTAPTPSASSVDVAHTVSFATTPSGGSGSYSSYAWTVSPATGLSCTATTTSSSTTCTASAASAYTVSVTVTDSAGHTSAAATSASFQVYPDPTVAVPSPSATSISLGQSVTFTTSLGLAGSGTDTYSWTAAPSGTAGCTASTSTTYTCTPTTGGGYTATATVTDSNGGTGTNTSATVTVTSSAIPSVTTPAPSRASADVGQAVTFTTSASGGSGTGYVFAWTASSNMGCGTSSTTNTLSCTPTGASSSNTISVTVTDSSGAKSSAAAASYVVYADPAAASPTGSPASVDVGQTVSFTTSASATGSGTDSYAWSSTPATGLGCATSVSTTESCTPTTGAPYAVQVTITDSNGGKGTATLSSYTVYAAPAMSAPTPSPASVAVGSKVTFTAQVTNPGAGISSTNGYTWSASAPALGCVASTANTYACTPTAAGTYSVSVVATDANGLTASASSANYVVTSGSTGGITVSASASPTSGTYPLTVTFTASQTGGSGTISYAWRFDDGQGGTGANPTHTYSNAGTYVAMVFVNDSTGKSGVGQVSVTVSSPSSTTPNSPSNSNPLMTDVGGLPLWFLLAIVALAAIIVAAVVLTRKKRPPMESSSGYPEGGDPSAAYAPVPMGAAAGGASAAVLPPQAPPPPEAPAPAPAPAPEAAPPPSTPPAPARPIDEVAPDPFGGSGRK